MLASLIILALAFIWLGYETQWLTVRLPVGKATNKTMLLLPAGKIMPARNPIDIPYYWKTPEDKEDHITLCVNCRLKCKDKSERWAAWKLPTKSIKAFDSMLNLNEGCNIYRAKFLKQIARDMKRKVTTSSTQAPLPAFIETVRIGSHSVFHETTPKHGYHQTVEETTTHYHDCLPGKAWLEEHCKDVLPEAAIELRVDGEIKASINGNYKRGMIKELVKQYIDANGVIQNATVTH